MLRCHTVKGHVMGMGLSSIELAALVAPYNVLGVCYRCGLVESLQESLPDKCSRSCIMTTCACVDLL
jgi:hypothetical protein